MFIITTILSIVLAHSECQRQVQNDKESEYIKVRNRYIEHFDSLTYPLLPSNFLKTDDNALKDLEERLYVILKDSKYSSKGKINLRTLIPNADFGLLDGLTFDVDSLTVVYTSKRLFFDHFKNLQINSLENLTQKNLGDIFSGAYITDARGYNLTSFKFKTSSDVQEYGMFGGGTNGFGPIFPEFLFVLYAKGDFIYMASKYIKQFGEIQKCITFSDSIFKRVNKIIHNSSNINNDVYLMEEAMEKYCDCYRKELKYDIHFKGYQKQIENIAKFLEQ